jgi:Domain of unknown function (DUF4395)
MLGSRFRLCSVAAYDCPHVLDHVDEAPRSGPLPRALVAVSTLLTAPSTTSARLDAQPIRRSMPQIDPRGQRFAAALTAVLLAVALVAAPSALTLGLLAFQTLVFFVGGWAGPASTPYAWVFRSFVRPRLGAPRELEDEAPPRFAQLVGLGFGTTALIGYAVGLPLLGSIAAGMALGAAFLNAVFGFCLGCEIYLLHHRLTRTTTEKEYA